MFYYRTEENKPYWAMHEGPSPQILCLSHPSHGLTTHTLFDAIKDRLALTPRRPSVATHHDQPVSNAFALNSGRWPIPHNGRHATHKQALFSAQSLTIHRISIDEMISIGPRVCGR